MEVAALIDRYPRLYHMAEKDSWPSIKARGLLSTSAALDRYQTQGAQRMALEEEHRPEKITLGAGDDQIVLRDQKPMEPSRLQEALVDGTTPSQWYKLLNGKVFMWAEEHRLFQLLNARHYRNLEHDVLTIDTAQLIATYRDAIWLCHMNSGNTFPIPHHRRLDTFKRIRDYPTKKNQSIPAKEVVEVVVDYSVPDIASYVVEVRRMKGNITLGQISL
ncbi:MAG: hypothetical protein IE917_01135 [Betaproteobacteria bacterium]|nr:hypothetical protein [Betaproteobacteria bacterium]